MRREPGKRDGHQISSRVFRGLGVLLVLLGLAPAIAEAQAPKPQGAVRELVSERSATSQTWVRADGSRVSRVWSTPATRVNLASSLNCQLYSSSHPADQEVVNTPACDHPWYGAHRVGWTNGDESTMARSIMKFDLDTALSMFDVISRATLKLWIIDSYGTGCGDAPPAKHLGVHRIGQAWDANATWSRATASTLWSPVHDAVGGGPFASTPEATIPRLVPPGSMQSGDVTSLVHAWQTTRLDPSAGLPNHGLLVSNHGPSACAIPEFGDETLIASSTYFDPAKRPFLEIESDPPAVAGSEISAPAEGEVTSRYVYLRGRTPDANILTARFRYSGPRQKDWADIPLSALRRTDGAPVTNADVPLVDGQTELLVWDLNATPGLEIDGPVHVRAIFGDNGAGRGGASPQRNFTLKRQGTKDGRAARNAWVSERSARTSVRDEQVERARARTQASSPDHSVRFTSP